MADSRQLGFEHISRHDNFFSLGGHSLMVIRLLAHLREIGLDTTVREIFEAPTLALLASTFIRYTPVTIPPNLITADCTKITPEMLPLITLFQTEIDSIISRTPGGMANIQDIYGLASLQHGMLFYHLKAERGDPYLIASQMSFIDRTTLEHYVDAMQQAIARHDILRTVFIWEGINEPAQVPSILTEITLDGSDESILEQLSRRFDPRYCRPDLAKAPLLRLLAAPSSEGSWMAIKLMHHIIGDHFTIQRMQAEIES